jgi:Na+/proline symporter
MRRGLRAKTRSRRCAISCLPENAEPIGFKAAFAAAAFAFVVVAIFALERVGAPDPLVVALGPLAGLIGIAGLGVLTRARTLLDFLVARRAVPPLYAGLALAAPIGGLALSLAGAEPDASRLPWRGVVAGVVFAALIGAPRWRGLSASALADVLATRFPSPFARVAFAAVLCASGWSLAAAGLGYAALTVRASFGLGADAALILCAVSLIASLAPGGLRSLVWTDAASAAAGLMTVLLFVALSADPAGADRLGSAAEALGRLPGAPFLEEFAAAAAVGSLFAFANPAFAVASPRAARQAGLTALLVLAIGGAAAAVLGDLAMKSPSDSALAALVACLPAMALARAGLQAASRPRGLDLLSAHRRLSVLASRRMARARGGVVLGAVVAAYGARISPNPSAPLYLALALWLAFATPSLALAALPGRRAAPAMAALAGSVAAALGGRLFGFSDPGYGPDLLVDALGAGMVGLAAGLLVFAYEPLGKTVHPVDPFVELPGEPGV